MRSLKLSLVLSVFVALLGLMAAHVAAPAVASAKPGPGVSAKILAKSHKVVARAFVVVKKGGEGKGLYRSAWIHQKAARAALRTKKPNLAAALSLKARALARKAMAANKVEATAEEADSAEETKAAEGVSEADVTAAAEAEAATAPTEEEVMKAPPAEEKAE